MHHQKKSNNIKQPIFSEAEFPVIVALTHGRGDEAGIPHYHSELEFHLILQGEGRYFIGGTIYPIKKNSVLLIHGNQVHNSLPLPRPSNLKRISLYISPKLLRDNPITSAIIQQLYSCCHITLSERSATMVKLLLEEIYEEYQQQDHYWRETLMIDIQKFLFTLDRVRVSQISSQGYVNPLLKKVVSYLEDCFADKVLLVDIAEQFCMSPCSLSRAFRRHTGIGFKSYLIHRRIVEAKRLLEETDLKVSSVAGKVGFDDLSTFNRDFKLLVGVSPSDYRKIST